MLEQFHLFTGKGGVGKTLLSLAYAYHLTQMGKKVVHLSLEPNTSKFIDSLGIKEFSHRVLDLNESSFHYITRKLGKVVATLITHAPFYKAVFDMVPGMGHIVSLGQIIDYLDEEKETYFILDAPSSGHVLTMFQSLDFFGDIFSSGIIFNDIQKMKKTLQDQQRWKIHLISLPQSMPLQETKELATQIEQIFPHQYELIFNSCWSEVKELTEHQSSLHEHLAKKYQMEENLLKTIPSDSLRIPFILEEDPLKIIKEISLLFAKGENQ